MRHLGKLDVATGFEKSPKVQYISQSGHTEDNSCQREKTNRQIEKRQTQISDIKGIKCDCLFIVEIV